jgi:hypothetical protein
MPRHLLHMEPTETALLPAVAIDQQAVQRWTVGSAALAHGQYAAAAAENADYFSRVGTPQEAAAASEQAESAAERTRELVAGVRNRIADAPNDYRIDEYLQGTFGGQFTTAQIRGARHRNIREWLADGEQGASHDQIYGFVEKHVELIASRQQSPEVSFAVERAKKSYIQGVEHAIDMGVYVPEAREGLQRVAKAKVVIGDLWDSAIMQGALAYRMTGEDYIVLAQDFDPVEGKPGITTHHKMDETLIHEFDHLQFSDSMVEMGMPSSFREAHAEHAKLSIIGGYWHQVNPFMRSGDRGNYVAERLLQDTINNDGKRPIDPMLAIRAHSAPAGHKAWYVYLAALERSSVANVHQHIEDNIDAIQARLLENSDAYQTSREARVDAINQARDAFKEKFRPSRLGRIGLRRK